MGQKSSKPAPNYNGADPLPRDLASRDSWMKSACHSALASVQHAHGGPFGAAVVHTRTGRILSCSHNTVLLDKNPTRHAEMNAIREAAAAMRGRDVENEDVFSECELFTTCEPCPMCLGAIHRCRFHKVHVGVDRKCAAVYGFDDLVFYQEVAAIAGRLDRAENNLGEGSDFLTVVLAPSGGNVVGTMLARAVGGINETQFTTFPKKSNDVLSPGRVSVASTSASFSSSASTSGGLVLQTKIGVGFLLSPEAPQLTILQDMLGMDEVGGRILSFRIREDGCICGSSHRTMSIVEDDVDIVVERIQFFSRGNSTSGGWGIPYDVDFSSPSR